MRSRVVVLAALGAVLVAGPAGAGSKPLVTAPLQVFLGSNVRCTALNAGKKPAAVHVEIVAVCSSYVDFTNALVVTAP